MQETTITEYERAQHERAAALVTEQDKYPKPTLSSTFTKTVHRVTWAEQGPIVGNRSRAVEARITSINGGDPVIELTVQRLNLNGTPSKTGGTYVMRGDYPHSAPIVAALAPEILEAAGLS